MHLKRTGFGLAHGDGRYRRRNAGYTLERGDLTATYSKMIQNLVWATGYNAFAIPLAAGAMYAWGVLLSPALGAALMAASTVIVAINARLLSISRGSDTTAAMPQDKQGGDSQQQIAKRAYELYEQHGHQKGHEKQDWLQAEQEIQRDDRDKD